jgi:hypothetical protein
MPTSTVNVRTTQYANRTAEQALKIANKERKKMKKAPLSKSRAIEVAIENVAISKLVEA